MVLESSSGGTGRHVLDLAEGLTKRGCQVHVLYSTGRTDRFFLDRLERLARAGLRFTPMPMRTRIHPSDFAAVVATRRYLDRFGPFDVVHGHSSKGGAVARLAAFGKGVTTFYTLHGFIIMDPGVALLKRLVYLLIELALSLRTSRIIAVAPEEERSAVWMGLGRSRVLRIPNGVDPAELMPRDVARRQLGLDDNAFVIGFVGRLVSQKAPDVLVRAMRQVAAAAPNARLAMVGAGPLDQPLRVLARKTGVEDRILWLGERDVSGVLSALDVFAVSSCKEGLPYVVLEAMSAGLPVVATATAGVESLVESGVNGIVVACGDVDAFGDALVELARDPIKLQQYGRASRDRASSFTIDAMVERTLSAYWEALPGRDAVEPEPERSRSTSGASAAPVAGMALGASVTREPDPS
jgi:glycosyltransferase involved in cell wall biosynthesis